jgi:DNA-binding response OmpR family regulator
MAHILVVDAETPIRALTRRSLIMERHDVIDVGTGADALAALRSRIFDVIVIDVDLPDMDGYDLVESIGLRPDSLGTPVIVVTGRDDPVDELRAAGSGVMDRLIKPVGFGQLISAVRRILDVDREKLDDLRVMRSEAADLYRKTIDLTNEARQRT